MPASSIHHTVHIDTEDGVERLLQAMEKSRETAGRIPHTDVEAQEATEEEVRRLLSASEEP